MITTFHTIAVLLAEAADGGNQGQGGGLPLGGLGGLLPMVAVFAAFWYFILYLPMKRKRTRQAALLAAIKKKRPRAHRQPHLWRRNQRQQRVE